MPLLRPRSTSGLKGTIEAQNSCKTRTPEISLQPSSRTNYLAMTPIGRSPRNPKPPAYHLDRNPRPNPPRNYTRRLPTKPSTQASTRGISGRSHIAQPTIHAKTTHTRITFGSQAIPRPRSWILLFHSSARAVAPSRACDTTSFSAASCEPPSFPCVSSAGGKSFPEPLSLDPVERVLRRLPDPGPERPAVRPDPRVPAPPPAGGTPPEPVPYPLPEPDPEMTTTPGEAS